MIPQSELIEKIVLYLQFDLESSKSVGIDKQNRESVIKRFQQSGGECNALSILWVYGMKIEELEQPQTKPIDGIKFFEQTITILEQWDGKHELSIEQKRDVERLISNIVYYQDLLPELGMGVSQNLFLEKRFTDTKDRSIVRDLSTSIVLDKSAFLSRLKTIVKPQTMISLSHWAYGHGHRTSVYQDASGKIFLFDPNQGVSEFSSIDKLVSKFWDLSDPKNAATNPKNSRIDYLMVKMFLRDLYIEAFRFGDEKSHDYPIAKIEKLNKDEFLKIMEENKFILILNNFEDDWLEKLVLQLDENAAMEILNDKNTDQALNSYMLKTYQKNPLCSFKRHSTTENEKRISLKEVLGLIAKEPDKFTAAEKILTENQASIEMDSNGSALGFAVIMLGYNKNIEEAKSIIRICEEQFGLKLSIVDAAYSGDPELLKISLEQNGFSKVEFIKAVELMINKSAEKVFPVIPILISELMKAKEELTWEERISLLHSVILCTNSNYPDLDALIDNILSGLVIDGENQGDFKYQVERIVNELISKRKNELAAKVLTIVLNDLAIPYSEQELKGLSKKIDIEIVANQPSKRLSPK